MKRVAALVLGLAGIANGHDFWIEPAPADAKRDAPIDCVLRVGDFGRGDVVPRSDAHIVSFRAFDAIGERDLLGTEGAAVAGSTTLRAPGTTVIAYASRPTRLELDAFHFALYLHEAGLDAIVKERDARGESRRPGREAFARCAKSLIRGEGDASGFDREVGLSLELVARSNPFEFTEGDAFRVVLMQNGRPLANTRVSATALSGERLTLLATTDERGGASFELPRAGSWLVHAVTMRRAEECADVDWQSTWASLTFTTREAPAERAEPQHAEALRDDRPSSSNPPIRE
ncbi:MAG: DUF4198 domain-containing protein [Planctomycetes bacterium]|nr:DUF4198 domain-containing protein [Planctomycetota bacterium]